MGLKITIIINLIVVFCACNDVTHKAERKWSAATYLGLEILSRKRSENLVACYSYRQHLKRLRYSNRAVTTLMLAIELVEQAWFIFEGLYI